MFLGNILAQTQVTFGSNSKFDGRAFAFSAIVFESGSDTTLPATLPDLFSKVTKQKRIGNAVEMKIKDAAEFDIADCANFAVNAGTSVNFNGDLTTVSGLVGVSPSTAIQGNYGFTSPIYNLLQVNNYVSIHVYILTLDPHFRFSFYKNFIEFFLHF